MTLYDAELGKEYVVKSILAEDEELKSFLFTLGCYEGSLATVVSKRHRNIVLVIKDARYSIDRELANTIEI